MDIKAQAKELEITEEEDVGRGDEFITIVKTDEESPRLSHVESMEN